MCDVPDKRVQNDACISSAEREEQITKAQPKGNVPALRFPEFSGEWHKHSLGEIGETIIGLTYKPSDVVADNGIIVLRSSNIKNGVIDYSDLVRVNKHVKDRIITKENDILVCSRNGSQRLIGKNAIIKLVSGKWIVSNTLPPTVPMTESICTVCAFGYFNRNCW